MAGLQTTAQFFIAKKNSNGRYSIFDSQGVKSDDGQAILEKIDLSGSTTITPTLFVRDSDKQVVVSGSKAKDVFRIIGKSFTNTTWDFGNRSVSLYLIHRVALGLLYLRSQTSEKFMTSYLAVATLDRATGRFQKDDFLDLAAKDSNLVGTKIWAGLSDYLKKLDQDYIDKQPMTDMLLRSFMRISPDYQPQYDSQITFKDVYTTFPEDFIFVGAVVSSDSSLTAVLVDQPVSYSKSVIQEGYMTDSKSRKALISFIDSDPFLKAAFSTTRSKLDGDGLTSEKISQPESVVKDAMMKVSAKSSEDVYGIDSSWLNWWTKKQSE